MTVVGELQSFCQDYNANELPTAEELDLRLKQRLGLRPETKNIYFVEMWVFPGDMFRPSPDPEITDHEAELDFPRSIAFVWVSDEHIEWINRLKSNSYGEHGYPWTRLGYSYDWAESRDTEVGPSEFVIKNGAIIGIHSVTQTQHYCR